MIKRLITSYFNVVKKNINDSVPKTIITFLVNGVIDDNKLIYLFLNSPRIHAKENLLLTFTKRSCSKRYYQKTLSLLRAEKNARRH